jgi:hypothetical protein
LSPAAFQELALRIAAFQARYLPGFRRLLERSGSRLEAVDDIPAVPVLAFRSARIAVHPPELDEVRFVTSGTTDEHRGMHALRTTRTYRELATLAGRRALLPDGTARAVVVALAPDPGQPPSSSLGFMMQAFMQSFDGRGIQGPAFAARSSERWLAGADGVDIPGLCRAAGVARERGEPLLVLSTSLALVALLHAAAGKRIAVPERTLIMQTGGFKGRHVATDAAALREQVARTFGVSPGQVRAEYGMTELSSQLYETDAPGVYAAPPWLSVSAVDPVTLARLPDETAGLARFVDLANVDSAVAIVTEDLIRTTCRGVELLGRRPGAPARGCSLALESLLLGAPRS